MVSGGTRGDRLVLGTRKGLFVFDRAGSGWRVARHEHRGTPVAYAAVDRRNGAMWACIDHGHWGQKLSRSRDGGATWHELPSPSYPDGEQVADGFPRPDAPRTTSPASLRYLWVFAEGGDDRPGRLYLGTEPGGLFVSNDDGASFALVRGLWDHASRLQSWTGGGRDTPGIHSIVVDPRDSTHVYVGISCAGVFETLDDGATWRPRNRGLTADFLPDPNVEVGFDPHFVAICPARPDAMWQQNHCGVFRSDDGGASWIDVSNRELGAFFGFPIAVDERDARQAWIVPGNADQDRSAFAGKLQVLHTRDGGASWMPQASGLPAPAHDIVLRHALDKAGDRLAFASTTGNAYWSDDRGESWRCLSNNLPPVYSIRFA